LEPKKADSSVERLNSQRIDLMNANIKLEKELQDLKTETIDLKKIYHERFDENTKLIDENRKLSGVFHENTVLLNKYNKLLGNFAAFERQHGTLKAGYDALQKEYRGLEYVNSGLRGRNEELNTQNAELVLKLGKIKEAIKE
jgi:regulator of replication initiation timing